MAVRAALGASRKRLLRQLLAETTLLALIGGAFGLLLTYGGLRTLAVTSSKSIPELARVHIDIPVLVFVFVASSAAGVLFGLAPALEGSKTDLQGTLKQGTQSSASKRSERTRSLLVFAEIALSSLLLIGSVLMLRSFVKLTHQDPGFNAQGLLAAEASLMRNNYPEATDLLRFYRDASERLKHIPGVTAVAMTSYLPFGGNSWGNSFEVEGKLVPEGSSAQIRPVSPEYFHTMGIPLRGREFSETDIEKAPGVAIINRVMANRFWPGEDPIDQRIRFGEEWLTIVGVCGEIKHARLDEATEGEIYVPYPQVPAAVLKFVGRDQNFVLRTANAGSVAAAVRNAIHAEAPEIVVNINRMQSLIDDTTAQPRFRTGLIAIFSALALVLAAVGIYAVLAYSVTQRFKELGIRIALGAQRADIRRLILGHALRLAALATACGLLAAYFLSHFLRALLFGVTIHDPLTYFAVPPLMLGIALLAGYWPARHASKVSPTISLRYE
jgi:putative ABC transport system permease protein